LFEQRRGEEMTFGEKLREDHKNDVVPIPSDFKGIGCPKDYGYEKGQDFCEGYGETCTKCWNREMPNTEPKVEDKSFAVQCAYRKGKKDAWELANKIHVMSDKEFDDVFGYVHKEDVFCYLNYDEALAKLKAYEEAQSKIEVGDVVKDKYDDIAVVLDETESYFSVLTKCGCVGEWKKDICKKTGKHIDIQSILEQIGE
jgi:hypothetical protein